MYYQSDIQLDINSNMIKTNCNHTFHYNCIVSWVGVSLINNGNAICPYYRSIL